MLIGARLLQGLAAALISPNVLAIVGVVYRGPSRIRALTASGSCWSGRAWAWVSLVQLVVVALLTRLLPAYTHRTDDHAI